jgi:hypothetical protein
MDIGTMKDFLEDLMLKVEQLEAEVQFWRTTAQTAMDNTDKALAVIELHKAMKAVME